MTETQRIYQALGEVQATLVVTEDGTKLLAIGSEQYSVFVPAKVEEKYQKQYQGQLVFWRVYPQFVEQKLAFKVVTIANEPRMGHGQFKLQGDWTELGALRIYRNAETATRLNQYNWQPRSIPISWDDAPAPDDAFWQLQAELIDGTLKVIAAEGPFPHPPRLERRPKVRPQRQESIEAQPESESLTTTETIIWEELAPVSGKLELTIKLNTLPQVTKTNGQYHFRVDCDGQVVQISVKQKQWSKLEAANTKYSQWIAAIAGVMGAATEDGFVLEQPNIQVFERQVRSSEPVEKVKAEVTETAALQQPSMTIEAGTQIDPKAQQIETKLREKPDSQVLPPASQAEPKPKKIGKFNIQVK